MFTIRARVDEEDVVKALHVCGVYKSPRRANEGFTHFWVAIWGKQRLYAQTREEAWEHFKTLQQEYPDEFAHKKVREVEGGTDD